VTAVHAAVNQAHAPAISANHTAVKTPSRGPLILELMRRADNLKAAVMPSPVGNLVIIADKHSLYGVLWGDGIKEWKRTGIDRETVTSGETTATKQAIRQLTEYFKGKRAQFELPTAAGGTEFQQMVWNTLTTIPYGTTTSYQEQARSLGRESAVRAVASANGRNPISIIIPCHRVITATGEPGGFAGGTEAKLWLLNHEKQRL
jgi:methylated-DNA-[protein]-cysteine S-methyltransferase